MLTFRHSDDQAIQIIRDPDLTGKAAVGLNVLGEVQHGSLHGRLGAGLLKPAVLDIDVAGGARAGASAVGVDARNAALHSALHDAHAGLQFDDVFGAMVLDVCDFGHLLVSAGPSPSSLCSDVKDELSGPIRAQCASTAFRLGMTTGIEA